MRVLFSWVLILFALMPAGSRAESALVSIDEARALLAKPDVRFVFADAPAAFEKGHIPGSVDAYAHDLHYLADVRSCGGLPMCPATASKFIGETLGIDRNTRVIAYDDGRGANASGVWFLLKLYGHDKVQILDGGMASWSAKGLPTETGRARPIAKKSFQAAPRTDMIVTKDEVLKATTDKKYLILDARHSFDEYAGKQLQNALEAPGKEIVVARGGFIPSAVFSPWTKYAANKAGEADKPTFKAADQLQKQLTRLEKKGYSRDKTVISYCHVGLGRSTFQYMALKQAGHENVKVYVGSWDEWGNTPALPVGKVEAAQGAGEE